MGKGIKRPYKRTCRQFIDGGYGSSAYLSHKDFAQNPEQYIRPFLLIQKDLQLLFDYIEPADRNLDCYSYRILELLIRTCIEVEANCKAILVENGYAQTGRLTMHDYKKINVSHHLSSYEIGLPVWSGTKRIRNPFKNWSNGGSLNWYSAYNATKHDRLNEFTQASFDNLIDAVCGLVVLLSAQFWREDYIPRETLLAVDGPSDGMDTAIGEYFRVRFPTDWPEFERYDFAHEDVYGPDFVIQKFDYNALQ
jgi:hypothetical protein